MKYHVLTFCTLIAISPGIQAQDVEKWPPIPCENPYEAAHDQYDCDLLIVGGSSGGMAAALTAGRLGMKTIYVIRAPGDVAGLLGCCMNIDSDLPVRYLGGLPVELDTVARYRSGLDYSKLGNHGAGFSAPSHVYFNYIRPQLDAFDNLTIIANYYVVGVDTDEKTRRVQHVRFRHRTTPGKTLAIRPRVTIDAEVEGDTMALAGVDWTLKREGRHSDTDPTRNQESYAGWIFQRRYKATRDNIVLPESTHAADMTERTMAWNAILVLKSYPKQGASKTSPWILKRPPSGYDQIDPECITSYPGIAMGGQHVRSLAHRTLSYIEGWRMPDGRHVLLSMNIEDREKNEKKHLTFALAHLYKLQHVHGKLQTGLADEVFGQKLPAKYTLKDFGTETFGGDMPLPSLIYVREGRRMVNDHVFGGKLIEDDGSGLRVQRRPPSARAAFFNAMLIDHHPVSPETAKEDHSRPQGYLLLRMEGLHDFGTPPIPFDVFMPRAQEATDLLVANAGAYTHQAYAAFPRMEPGRILQGHACAALAYHAIRDNTPVHRTDVAKAQLTLLKLHGQSITHLPDSLSGTKHHVVDQMLAARNIPAFHPETAFPLENEVSYDQANKHLHALKLKAVAWMEHVEGPMSLQRALAAFGLERPATVPDRNIRLSEWKALLFNAAFSRTYDASPVTLDLAAPLAWDTFSRQDRPLQVAESSQAWQTQGSWQVEDGALRAEGSKELRRAWIPVIASTVVLSSDLYLEQLKQGAAGLELRDGKSGAAITFMLRADRHRITAELTVTAPGAAAVTTRHDLGDVRKRGFNLELQLGETLTCLVDDRVCIETDAPKLDKTLRAGLVNESGLGSWFDNVLITKSVRYLK